MHTKFNVTVNNSPRKKEKKMSANFAALQQVVLYDKIFSLPASTLTLTSGFTEHLES